MTEFAQKQKELREKSFTEKFLKNELCITADFDELEINMDPLMLYKDGGIMGAALDLNEHNLKVLSNYIKDFEAYNELVDIEYSSAKTEGQTDLISLIDYAENLHGQRILYDAEDDFFYTDSDDE